MVEAKLKNLDEQKKKGNTKKNNHRKEMHTDEESVGNNTTGNHNPHQIPDKKNYLNQWMAKLEKFKEKI